MLFGPSRATGFGCVIRGFGDSPPAIDISPLRGRDISLR